MCIVGINRALLGNHHYTEVIFHYNLFLVSRASIAISLICYNYSTILPWCVSISNVNDWVVGIGYLGISILMMENYLVYYYGDVLRRLAEKNHAN